MSKTIETMKLSEFAKGSTVVIGTSAYVVLGVKAIDATKDPITATLLNGKLYLHLERFNRICTFSIDKNNNVHLGTSSLWNRMPKSEIAQIAATLS